MRNPLAKLFSYLESDKNLLSQSCLTFFFVIHLRNFIEAFSQPQENYFYQTGSELGRFILHADLTFVCLGLSFIILLFYITKKPIRTITKLILPLFSLLLIAPIMDLIFSKGQGFHIGYFPETISLLSLVKAFFVLGNNAGITIGMQIEIMTILCGFFCYFRFLNKPYLVCGFYTLAAYSILFLCGMLPIMIKHIQEWLGFSYTYSNRLMTNYYAVILFALGAWLSYLANAKNFMVIMQDILSLRFLHYVLMFLFGISLSISQLPIGMIQILHKSPDLIINTLFGIFSIFFAGIFSVIFNNFADQQIDAISNPMRPLITKIIDRDTYKIIGYFACIAAMFYALLIDIKALFLIVVVMGIYYLYSVPPLRFKRMFLFSKLAVSGNSLILILLGFMLLIPNISYFPPALTAIYLLGFTVAANFIDFKDIDGDRAAGIKTLPVVLGVKATKLIIGTAFFCSYISFYFLFSSYFLLPALMSLGAAQVYLVNQASFDEKKVFLLYIVSMLLLISYVLMMKIV